LRQISNTTYEAHCPWPEGMLVKGGEDSLVYRLDGSAYETAWVEAFPFGRFLRGEGPTIRRAEWACWQAYERMMGCSHMYGFRRAKDPRGPGTCNRCGTWFSEQLIDNLPMPAGTGRALTRPTPVVPVIEDGQPDEQAAALITAVLADRGVTPREPVSVTTSPARRRFRVWRDHAGSWRWHCGFCPPGVPGSYGMRSGPGAWQRIIASVLPGHAAFRHRYPARHAITRGHQ